MREVRTARLHLRPYKLEDIEALVALLGDWEVARMLSRVPHPYTPDDARRFIPRAAAAGPGERIWGVFTDRLIGGVGTDHHLGYWLGRPFWGQGFATEAAAAAVDEFFAESEADNLVSGYFAENQASARVLAKLGFGVTGRSAEYSLARKTTAAHVDMRLTRCVWQAQRSGFADLLGPRAS